MNGTARAAEGEALSVRIDRWIESESGGMVAGLATDEEFLRRVSLDLNGVPPTREELQQFLADPSADKRAAAIDRLLSRPQYARHMAQTFDVMLMERRPATQTSQEEWYAYLLESFRANKPFHQLAREILTSDGFDPATRGIARFYLDRELEPNAITRDVGRIFFGQDLQCAQCHDHPIVGDYHQKDYQGLLAFFEPGFAVVLKKEGDKEVWAYGERAGGDREFESVFVKGQRRLTGPRLPGEMEIEEPTYYPGDEYEVKPGGTTKPVPKFSRRAKLAELATSGTNRSFNENIANRLWGHMMGVGLVHPPDLRHSGNPPTYPELLHVLGEEFASMGFDVKRFLRELALTRTYQRSLDVPEDVLAQSRRATELLAHLESSRAPLAKELEESQAAFEASNEAWSGAEQALLAAVADLKQVRGKAEEAAKKVSEAEKATQAAQASLAGKESVAQPLAEAAAKAQAVAEKLKEDKELAEAAAKIAAKAGQMQSEVETLRKAVEETSAALAGTMGEMNTARQEMDTVVETKVAPVEQSERAVQQSVIAARKRFVDAATKLIGLDQRIEKVEAFAHIATLEDIAQQSKDAIVAAEGAIAAAQAELSSFDPIVQEHQAKIDAAEAERVKASEAYALVEAEHKRIQSMADSMTGAYQTVQVALRIEPTDGMLTDVSGKFEAKATQFAEEVAAHQSALDASLARVEATEQQLADLSRGLEPVVAEREGAAARVAAAQEQHAHAVAKAESDRVAVEEAISKLAESWVADFTIAALKPLTAEQMCWSVLRVSGVESRYRAAEIAELEKSAPLSEEAKQDPAQLAAREREIEQRVYDKLKGNVGLFVRVFAAAAGQPQGDFFATADQALFVENGEALNPWIAPSGGNVTERIAQEADMTKAAVDLYQTVLSRSPSEGEIAEVARRLTARPEEKAQIAQELVWGLVTSAEFRFSH